MVFFCSSRKFQSENYDSINFMASRSFELFNHSWQHWFFPKKYSDVLISESTHIFHFKLNNLLDLFWTPLSITFTHSQCYSGFIRSRVTSTWNGMLAVIHSIHWVWNFYDTVAFTHCVAGVCRLRWHWSSSDTCWWCSCDATQF